MVVVVLVRGGWWAVVAWFGSGRRRRAKRCDETVRANRVTATDRGTRKARD